MPERSEQFARIDGQSVSLSHEQKRKCRPAAVTVRDASFRIGMVETARPERHGMAGGDAPTRAELAFDNSARKRRDTPARREKTGTDFLGKLKSPGFIGIGIQPIAKRIKVVKTHHILGVISQGSGKTTGRTPQVNPATQPQQEMEGFEIAGIARRHPSIDGAAGEKLLPSQCPDPAEEETLGIVFQIKAVYPVGNRAGALRLTLPQIADVKKVFERVECFANAVPESFHQTIRIVNRRHIEEGIEIFIPQIRHISHSVGHRGETEPVALPKLAAIDGALLERHDKRATRLFLDIVFEKKSDIKVRAGRHLAAPGAAGRNHRKGPLIPEGGLLPCRPARNRPRENSGPFRNDRQTVVKIRREDEGVILRDEPTVFFGLR